MEAPHDPVTRTAFSPDDLKRQQDCWRSVTERLVAGLPRDDLPGICRRVYEFLDRASRGEGGNPPDIPLCEHAPDSYLTDHALLVSAIAYCLSYDDEKHDLDLLRLAALTHECPHGEDDNTRATILERVPSQARDFLERAWRHLDEQEAVLESALSTDDSLQAYLDKEPPPDPDLEILSKAHLVASGRLYNLTMEDRDGELIQSIGAREDFDRHPLHRHDARVGLVFGGATKIKGYVFESAKLPEMRGASMLFDRINLLDAPALMGREPDPERYPRKAYEEAKERYAQVRRTFAQRIGCEPPLTPECIIYANGGDILTLAPVCLAEDITAEIERLYTTETLVGQSVAVCDKFTLLELQYGLKPTEYWLEQYGHDWQSGGRLILEAYYGRAGDLPDAERRFLERKCFNELAARLALMRHKRRDGNDHKPIPHYEVTPYSHRCHSCDRRGAVYYARQQEPEHYLCEPCARKTVTGLFGKKKRVDIGWFTDQFPEWHPQSVHPWYVDFEKYLTKSGQERTYSGPVGLESVDNPWDLGEIAQTSDPQRFIGVIYADGNNVGSVLQRIRTISEYRQFAQRLSLATQHAVFVALAEHLTATQITASEERKSWEPTTPDDVWIHPFEIISIGGDDLFLVVPGSKALDIAAAINRYLEERFDSEWLLQHRVRDLDRLRKSQRYAPAEGGEWRPDGQPVVSLSAGVVVAAEKTPFFFLQELATDLLHTAKAKAKGMKYTVDYYCGTVDFLFLKSVPMVTTEVKEFRNEAYAREEGRTGECLRLIARPYTTWEMEGLLETVRAFKAAEFPRSQLHAMRRFLRLGRLASMINYLYFVVRFDRREELLKGFHYAWHRLQDPVPWRSVDELVYESTLLDLLEIYEFVEHEP